MGRFGKQEFWQAGSCLLCLAIAWIRLDDIGASEFIGGRVTGSLFYNGRHRKLSFHTSADSDVFLPANSCWNRPDGRSSLPTTVSVFHSSRSIPLGF